jgi:hypothetical protein
MHIGHLLGMKFVFISSLIVDEWVMSSAYY